MIQSPRIHHWHAFAVLITSVILVPNEAKRVTSPSRETLVTSVTRLATEEGRWDREMRPARSMPLGKIGSNLRSSGPLGHHHRRDLAFPACDLVQ